MRTASLVALLTALPACAQAPGEIRSVPCPTAPRIDGVIGADEWPAAGQTRWSMPMTSVAGAAAPREAVLWVQNSRMNLYVALRVPDVRRDLDLPQATADLAVLAFCAGTALAEGDDRRVCLPGIFADKHFVAPGRDADDTARHGTSRMTWHADQGGYYVIEWQVPLNSGDRQDVELAPGDRVKFNLVFADGFKPGGEGMQIGGLYGGSADDAAGWGELVLAADVGPEAPAPVPAAIATLFPWTEAADRLEHRLRRLEVTELEVEGRPAAAVTVEFEYPTLAGTAEIGQGRIFLPPELLDDPATPRPLIHQAGYELDDNGAAWLMREGVIVSTPHAHPLNPLARGPNLDCALLHAMRGLPFVDGRQIHIQGGSAGGWTTLMVAAETFPIVGAQPAVPPLDWGYNAAFIGTQGATGDEPEDPTQSPTPILAAVYSIVQQLATFYNVPYDSAAFTALSPIAQLETITAPVQVFFSTADMLVPVDQVGAEHVRPFDAALFPAGFSTAPTACLPGRPVRTLAEALGHDEAEWFVPELPENPPAMQADGTAAQGTPPALALPFSRERRWSVTILDEGPCEPQVGHFKYAWALDSAPFRAWVRERGILPEQLNGAKLARLMNRYAGRQHLSGEIRPDGGEPRPIHLLDWPEAERADVLRGLSAYAADDACAARLGELYAALPAELKLLGDSLGTTPAEVRAALAAAR